MPSPASQGAFAAALAFVFAREGGYSNDPHDAGGETSFGITAAALQNAQVAGLVQTGITPKTLTREHAAAIYRHFYWDACRCEEFPPVVAVPLFDCAVNQGPVTAILMLQRALGVAVDGKIGPETLAAAKAAKAGDVLVDFLARRLVRYAQSPQVDVFMGGWARRVLYLHAACLEIAA